jgi:glucose dehydrogenase
MDNTTNSVLANVTINGQLRKVIYYGTKQGRTFVLDRTNGLPALPVAFVLTGRLIYRIMFHHTKYLTSSRDPCPPLLKTTVN